MTPDVAQVRAVIARMRIAMVAGQCAVDDPSMAAMAVAEAERCARWARALETAIHPATAEVGEDGELICTGPHCPCEDRRARRMSKSLTRDGWMCEVHPGTPWPHDDCPGPGMPWVIEGRDAIRALIAAIDPDPDWAR